MRRRIIGLTTLVLCGITLASCGSSTLYKNKNTKGKKVDSISFKYNENDITVTKDTKYSDLFKSYPGLFQPGIKRIDKNKYSSFCEKVSYQTKTDHKNSIIYDENNNNYYLMDEKNNLTVNAEATSYIFTNDEIFNLHNYKSTYKTNNSTEEVKNVDLKNAGYYSKYSDENIELATNSLYFASFLSNFDDGSSFYDNIERKNASRVTYSYGGHDHFRLYNVLSPTLFASSRDFLSNGGYSLYIQMPACSFLFIGMDEDPFTEFYENSIEITNKYLILKAKINEYFSIQSIEEMIISGQINNNSELEAEIKKIKEDNNESYIYKEVWIDYKNAEYGYGYDYCKYEYYNDKTYTGTYSSIDSYAVNADAVGKEHTLNMYSKCSAEVYSVNIKDNTIQKKKNEFIEKCKKNNILDKYEITKETQQGGLFGLS